MSNKRVCYRCGTRNDATICSCCGDDLDVQARETPPPSPLPASGEGERVIDARQVKAVSLWQPWASLVAYGLKQYETRSWPTSYRGLLAIHAAKRWTKAEWGILNQLCIRFPDVAYEFRSEMPPRGVVLCVCRLVNVYPTWQIEPGLHELERAVGDWSPGRFAWQLEMVQVYEKPIPVTGKQGLWDWPLPENGEPHE